MNHITRYDACTIASNDGLNRAAMEPSEHGAYVTYERHAEKMQALQSRLDALELMQKQDFFYHLQKGLGKVAEKAIEDLVKELVSKATQTVFKVNPCHNLTAEMVDELVERMNQSSQAFATGGLLVSAEEPETVGCMVRQGKIFVGDAYIKGGSIENAVSHNPANTASEYNITLGVKVEPRGLKCIKSTVDYFTSGKVYDYEIRKDVVYVAQDDLVSDLDGSDQWKTHDHGAYLTIKAPVSGEPLVMFKKPHA